MLNKKIIFTSILLATVVFTSQAKENIGISGRNAQNYGRLSAACNDATAQIELDINNVRARLLGAGDFWWNLTDGKYVVPKVYPPDIEVSSTFAGALWIGGIDAGGQLKIAAQTYRQNGNDFWPGPLNNLGTVDDVVCNAYDRHWKVNASLIDSFINLGGSEATPLTFSPTFRVIWEWPALGNANAKGKSATDVLVINKPLAPFVDLNFNGQYEPNFGEYPDVDGDQAIFWVYNDKGNIHTESGGDAIGVEIQATAFAFSTNDEINDMTFYRYNVINYATSALDSVFMGYWVDSDLGYAWDDWVGCDTALSLGLTYNGDAVDGPDLAAYGANPPLFGTDFFQGPIKYTYDGGSISDSVRLGMAGFLYYNNDWSTIGNPEVAAHYYGYLSGSWKDGSPFTYGGNGYGGTESNAFMFPSDPGDPLGWSECTEGNPPADRRFIISSGPFRLEPGATNEIVIGALWVRPPISGGCQTTFDAISLADQKAQALFDNDFELISGPDAPDMSIRELDKELILSITNGQNSNNKGESYEETDPIIKSIIDEDPTISDSTYNFQGYKIYQLVNGQVSSSEYNDPAKARLIFQCDLEDDVVKLVNFTYDPILGADVPVLQVDGNNDGIFHTFRITDDAFASGNTKIVNYKKYYFSVVAYAYNEFKEYDPVDPNSQKRPYLEGRNNIKLYVGIPHKTDPQAGGTILNAQYGDGPDITMVEGLGNGGNFLELTTTTVDEILANGSIAMPVYEGRHAPIDVAVYDPVRVPAADFQVMLYDSSLAASGAPSGYAMNYDSTWWVITNLTSGESVKSDFPIGFKNEQIIPDWGLAVTIKGVYPPGPNPAVAGVEWEANNGLIGWNIEYENVNMPWLSGVPNVNGSPLLNWLRSGVDETDIPGVDDNEVYESIFGGTIGPMGLTRYNNESTGILYMPLRQIIGLTISLPQQKLSSLNGIDIVFTSDRSKWSQCIVVNTGEGTFTNLYGENKMDLRQKPSIDQFGNEVAGEIGRSWFPGYAINVETGQRVNIFFGEDPFVNVDGNSDDMLFNPTDKYFGESGLDVILGGKHNIYVTRIPYDGGKTWRDSLSFVGGTPPSTTTVREVWKNVVWIGRPMAAPGVSMLSLQDGLIPTESKLKIRVTRRYVNNEVNGENAGFPLYNFSTKNLAATVGNTAKAESALDLINVVPNPYYAYSSYETSPVDYRIKITNLPSNCTISIFSMDGTLVRKFSRAVSGEVSSGGVLTTKSDNLDTSLEWDLKNAKGVMVASGVYLIHIDAGELGERTVKWFGAMRPIDLDTF
ncbi:MAG: hypothetical protein IPH61_06060 [Bacteroidetes bacterium]|nr:hypothetical protein [Bacteroidota bacterium]